MLPARLTGHYSRVSGRNKRSPVSLIYLPAFGSLFSGPLDPQRGREEEGEREVGRVVDVAGSAGLPMTVRASIPGELELRPVNTQHRDRRANPVLIALALPLPQLWLTALTQTVLLA